MSVAIDMDVLPGVPSQGTTATYVIPEMTDMNAPSLAALTGATSSFISCLITESPEVAVDQETWEDTRECLENAIEQLGREKDTIDGLIILTDPQNPTGELSRADAALPKGGVVYLVIRRGTPSREALAVGDRVSVYKVRVGAKPYLKPEANADIRRRVNLSVLDKAEDVVLVA